MAPPAGTQNPTKIQPHCKSTKTAPTVWKKRPGASPRRPNVAQSLPKASQSDSKIEPLGAKVCFPTTAFGLRLRVRITYRPLPKAPRDTPKRHPPERSTKMPSKIDFGRAFGGQWARWGAHGVPRAANGLQNASQMCPKFIENRPHPSSLPPQTTKTTNWLPKGSKIEGRPAFKSPAHVEKLAIVAAFTGQDRRCVRGPRGKNHDKIGRAHV